MAWQQERVSAHIYTMIHLVETSRDTWRYRTRMAIADGGDLIVLGPGVKRFGEDLVIDQLIRKVRPVLLGSV